MSHLFSKIPISKLDVFDIITMHKDALEYDFFPHVFEIKNFKQKIRMWRRDFRGLNRNHYFVLFINGYKGWIIIKEDFYMKEIYIEYALIFPQYRRQDLFKDCINFIREGGYTITLEAVSTTMRKVMERMRYFKIQIDNRKYPIYRNYLDTDYKQVKIRKEYI